MARKIEMPGQDEIEVLIPDPKVDLKRKYRSAPLTRSRKRELAAAQIKLGELTDSIPDDAEPTADQEEQVIRAACDILNILLDGGGDDAPDAGDLLFDSWMSEHITDDQIVALMNQIAATPDPT